MQSNKKTYYYPKTPRLAIYTKTNRRAFGEDAFTFRNAKHDCRIVEAVLSGLTTRKAIAPAIGLSYYRTTQLVQALVEAEVLAEDSNHNLSIAPLEGVDKSTMTAIAVKEQA